MHEILAEDYLYDERPDIFDTAERKHKAKKLDERANKRKLTRKVIIDYTKEKPNRFKAGRKRSAGVVLLLRNREEVQMMLDCDAYSYKSIRGKFGVTKGHIFGFKQIIAKGETVEQEDADFKFRDEE